MRTSGQFEHSSSKKHIFIYLALNNKSDEYRHFLKDNNDINIINNNTSTERQVPRPSLNLKKSFIMDHGEDMNNKSDNKSSGSTDLTNFNFKSKALSNLFNKNNMNN
jgi:hypothetical protein